MRAVDLRTRLGRIIRDIRRKIEGNTALEDRFGPLLDLLATFGYFLRSTVDLPTDSPKIIG